MFKFIVCGDLHWRGGNPRARRDDYMQALKLKLEEVFKLAIEHQAPVIIPGDIFNSPNTAWYVVAELIQCFNAFKKRSGLPIITIPGNHDIYGSNLDSVSRTPYGLMSMIGVIKDVDQYQAFDWTGLDTATTEEEDDDEEAAPPRVRISGHGYNADTDTPFGTYQFDTVAWAYKEKTKPIATIHLVHANIMPDPPGIDSMPHTLIDGIMTDADVIISGHYHPGWGVYRREDGVLFINPGALARTAATASDISRQVQVALLKVYEDGWCEAELVPLESAKPGKEILSRDHLEDAAERAKKIQDFLELLAEEGEIKFMEIRDIIVDIAERKKLPEQVREEALKRVSLAQEMLEVRPDEV